MLRICHVTDTHGVLPKLPDADAFDAIAITGDFFPGTDAWVKEEKFNKQNELRHQIDYTVRNAKAVVKWSHNKPIIWCSGNHDLINPCKVFKGCGVDITDATNTHVFFQGLWWYGFPFINRIKGEWANECTEHEMHANVGLIDEDTLSDLDVLLTHAPLVNINDRDMNGKSHGNVQLSDRLKTLVRLPKLHFNGHIHTNSMTVVSWMNGQMLSVNSAAGPQVISFISY